MAQQGKQMKVGACKGFAYNSVTLDLPANCNIYEVDYNTFFKVVKPSTHLNALSQLCLYDTHWYLVISGINTGNCMR